MRIIVLCCLLGFTLALAETQVYQPGPEGKDAEIDSVQGGSPHGGYPNLFMPVGG
jgi:hypothetical protein